LIYPTKCAVEKGGGSNLSNVLLACLDAADEAGVRELVARAQHGGRERLRAIAARERQSWEEVLPKDPGLRGDLWEQQADNAVDSYAAWSPLVSNDHYSDAYKTLKRAFAARKNTRDFRQQGAGAAAGDRGIPKSSLDGVNESVLPEQRQKAVRRMGLSKGEQLDALGCIKRSLGRQEQFTALTRLAADAWLNGLTDKQCEELRSAYAPLVGLEYATGANGNEKCYAKFPYDAGLLFGGALPQARRQAEEEGNHDAVAALKKLDEALKPIRGRPNPYVALMVADGDRMGTFVSKANSAESHGKISAAITRFADQVPKLAHAHRGHAIFNGGEDLMVAFPLSGVLEGAQALASAFQEAVKPMVDELMSAEDIAEHGEPTLRAGVAICHIAEPMAYIRHCAERAEKFAKGEAGDKQQGNALGLRLHVRAGHEIAARLPFSKPDASTESGAFAALHRWIDIYREGGFPGRLAYDVRQIGLSIADLLAGQPPKDTIEQAAHIADNAFKRLLDRAHERGGENKIAAAAAGDLRARRDALMAALAAGPRGIDVAQCYRSLGEELILARWMSAASREELGEREQAR
jgi:CRISPR-associated protein Cmr2